MNVCRPAQYTFLFMAAILVFVSPGHAEDEVVIPPKSADSEENFDEEEDFGEELEASEEVVEPLEDLKAQEEAAPPEENLEPIEEPAPYVENQDELPLEEPAPTPAPLELQAQDEPIEPPAPVADEPDLNYEAKLHDIFVQFYNSKTPQAEWDALTGSRNAERYRIQHGDNLWNVSQTIFGDGRYWPKVWSLNKDITNPHLISPNNSIRFLLGDESEPPAFTVTENATEETVTEPPKEGPVAGAVDESEPEIPPPVKVSRPVVKKIPPSLPQWQEGTRRKDDYDEMGIDYGRRRILDVEDSIPLTSYITDELPASRGTVSEIEVGHRIASAFQYIYVEMKPGQAQVGDTLLAVSNGGEVISADPTIKGFLGYGVEVQGEIQIVERVTGADEDLDGVETFRALVLKIINPVRVGASLVVGKLEKVRVTEEGPRSQVVSQIIGGSFFNARRVYGSESIVYLNRGESDGLSVGQILPLRANRKVRDPGTTIDSNIRPIGWLRVVKTTPNFSTGVIVRAWSDVLSGDLTGSGEILPSLSNKGASEGLGDGQSSAKLSDEFDDSLQSESDNAIAPQAAPGDEDGDGDDEDFGDDEID
jgi:hypothetical protein